MTLFAADHSTQRTIAVMCVVLALLVLPCLGMLHCQVRHDDHGRASTPPAQEACCVFFCFTALMGVILTPLSWLMIGRVAPYLKPVRLTNHLTRWVPPPRPIDSLT